MPLRSSLRKAMARTMPEIQAYPLQWPAGWPRTPSHDRKHGRFSRKEYGSQSWPRQKDIRLHQAISRIEEELTRMSVPWSDTIVSSDLKVRRDGLPYSGQRMPDDPGISVWFTMDGQQQVIAIDTYTKIEQNAAAVAATIQALRALDRHGGQILQRAFTGFQALPDPASSGGESWETVLGLDPLCRDLQAAEAAYRRLRGLVHPDRGGDAEQFRRVQRAIEKARADLRA